MSSAVNMTVNVTLKEADSLYLAGVKHFLVEAFQQKWNYTLIFTSSLNTDTYRENSIISATDDTQCMSAHSSFYRDIKLIPRHISSSEFKETISEAWSNRCRTTHCLTTNPALRCLHKTGSAQPSRIMSPLHQGISASDVTLKLGLSEKNFSYNYMAMRKFGQKTDYQLHAFLRDVQSRDVFQQTQAVNLMPSIQFNIRNEICLPEDQ
ncbi:hypothetical protein ACLBW0_09265 [Enterobacteriaceae bacterium C34A]